MIKGSELQIEYTGYLQCPSCLDIQHPQDEETYFVNDGQPLRDISVEPADIFEDALVWENILLVWENISSKWNGVNREDLL